MVGHSDQSKITINKLPKKATEKYMILTIESIVWLAALVFGIWFMVSKKKNIHAEQPSLEPLTGKEKLLVFVLCLVNPILLGAIFYFGWKKKLPQQAKTANRLSFIAFAIFLILYFGTGYLIVKQAGVENFKNIATTVNQVKDLNQQILDTATKIDPEDQMDISAMQNKVVIGYSKAEQWQQDAKFYSFRRIYTVPADYSDQILKSIDSYYYESKNTQDNYEILFDRTSDNIQRIDVNPNRLANYVSSFADLTTIKIGPKKALEIAMLSPAFQKFKAENPQLVTQVILNDESSQNTEGINKFWLVTLYKNFGSAGITSDNSVTAYVDINTGKALLPEGDYLLQQLNEAESKLR